MSRVPLAQISSRAWEHPADRAALNALKAIPGFDEVVRRIATFFGERGIRQLFLANAVRVGPRQRPKLNALYTEVLETMDWPRRPQLYVSQNPIVNALAAGGTREKVVATALTYLGDPYVLDGADHSGIDCSGLVMQAYAAVGIRLGHLVHLQDDAGRRIDESDARPGDLVVFDDEEHIALYLGGGMIVQAPEVGRPVEVTTVWSGVPHHFTTLLGQTQ